MIKITFSHTAALFALAAAAAGDAQAQTTPAPAPAPVAAAPVPAAAAPMAVTRDADPALWVVKDADTTIYMLGTVHVLKPGLGWFDEAVKTAFDASDEMVLEVVLPDDATAQKVMVPLAIDADGPPLTQKLPEGKRAAYTAALGTLGMPGAAFDQFDPWFGSLMLGLPLQKLGYDPKSGVETQLTDAAKAAGKPITGLEGFEEQLGFFDKMPEDQQIGMLVSTVDNFADVGPMLDKMVGKWAAGDPDGLAAVMNEQLDEMPGVAKLLLTDRNDRWADWMKTRMEKPGTVFMAVGAGHLAGKGSVQDALKARGLTATRVKY